MSKVLDPITLVCGGICVVFALWTHQAFAACGWAIATVGHLRLMAAALEKEHANREERT